MLTAEEWYSSDQRKRAMMAGTASPEQRAISDPRDARSFRWATEFGAQTDYWKQLDDAAQGIRRVLRNHGPDSDE